MKCPKCKKRSPFIQYLKINRFHKEKCKSCGVLLQRPLDKKAWTLYLGLTLIPIAIIIVSSFLVIESVLNYIGISLMIAVLIIGLWFDYLKGEWEVGS